MQVKYTKTEIISMLRDMLGIPLSQSEDLDEMVNEELISTFRRRYLALFAIAPLEQLPIVDIASEVRGAYVAPSYVVVTLPDSCYGVMSVRLSGWTFDVVKVYPTDCELFRRQAYPMLRATSAAPAVFQQGNMLHIFGACEGAVGDVCEVESLRAVAIPASEEEYLLTPWMLNELMKGTGHGDR